MNDQIEKLVKMCLEYDPDFNTIGLYIKHKALSVAPRCADQLYEVVTCTRCDYMDATLVSQLFIYCCPED